VPAVTARDDAGAVSHWLALLQSGEADAAQPLWEAYYARLVRLARARAGLRGHADAEDIAQSAFKSFCLGAARGRFPRLKDRFDLWRLLVVITARKAADHLKRQAAQKRGGGLPHESPAVIAEVIGREPTPEFAAMVAEEFQRLLDRLGDDRLRQVALWKMEGYTNQQISERLGCALRTVANKLELIRKTLQDGDAS
jgi:RNA polymerase sigma factor (sigma-70 family)